MKGSRAAQRYAKAILGLASDKKAADAVFEDMKSIFRTLDKNKELKRVLGSPVIKGNEKKNVLRAIFKNAHSVTLGAFDILIENRRIGDLDLVARQYIARYNVQNRTQEAVVTTAVALSPELEKKVQAKVKELTGSGASIKNVIDKDMIGGFVLRVGDLQYDASIAQSLNRLRRELYNNNYVSKI